MKELKIVEHASELIRLVYHLPKARAESDRDKMPHHRGVSEVGHSKQLVHQEHKLDQRMHKLFLLLVHILSHRNKVLVDKRQIRVLNPLTPSAALFLRKKYAW